MTLKAYLQTHFVDKPTFASLSGVSLERLDDLIAAKAIPEPTYRCCEGSIRSAAFGVIEIDESLFGEYFRPECARWTRVADRAGHGEERVTVLAELSRELETALQLYFQDSVVIEERIRAFLPYFFNGTFGLCAADPSTGAGIARKEILQERLGELTTNGTNPSPVEVSKSDLLQLIDDYAISAMPFSPAEYALSSRKRLVDDLRSRVVQE